ncbi:hypothetical protein NL108_004939 [Boleophthalmus pectinirostris]|nr:hypothetical protein NL108_004939 [Boleophthalmus pectinirostris]
MGLVVLEVGLEADCLLKGYIISRGRWKRMVEFFSAVMVVVEVRVGSVGGVGGWDWFPGSGGGSLVDEGLHHLEGQGKDDGGGVLGGTGGFWRWDWLPGVRWRLSA